MHLDNIHRRTPGKTVDPTTGQNMTFVCNATPSVQALDWVVELIGQTTASGALTLANAQPRIETEVTSNLVNPSNINILNAMLGDSNTTVTCKDGADGNIIDVATIYVEGKHCCMCMYVCIVVVFNLHLSPMEVLLSAEPLD